MKSKNNNFKFRKKQFLPENNICPKSTTSKIEYSKVISNLLKSDSAMRSDRKSIHNKKYNDKSSSIKTILDKDKENKNNSKNNKNFPNVLKNKNNLFQSNSEIYIEKNWSSNKKNNNVKKNNKIAIEENNVNNFSNYDINKKLKENKINRNKANNKQILNKENGKNNKRITNNNQQYRKKEVIKEINKNYHSNKSTNEKKEFNQKLKFKKLQNMKKKIIENSKNLKLKNTYKSPVNKTKDSSKNHSKSNNTSSNTSNIIKTSDDKKILINLKGVKIESINLDLSDQIERNNFNLNLTCRRNDTEEDNFSSSVSHKSSFSSYYKLHRLNIKRNHKKMMNNLHKKNEKNNEKINSLFIDFYKNIIYDKREDSFKKTESNKLIDRIRKIKKLNKS